MSSEFLPFESDEVPVEEIDAYFENLHPPTESRLVPVPLADVQMRSIEWLERPLWQRSAFQLLAGAKGSGKGTYLAASQPGSRTAARTSSSSRPRTRRRSTSNRGSSRPTPTSRAASRSPSTSSLPDDVAHLGALAHSLGGVGLLVVDPVANHIGAGNSNDDVEVRHAIAPLNRLADELGCLLIGVRHPGKDRSRGAVASILGSTAWVDTPRAVVMIAVDDEDPAVRHIQVVAGNRSLNGTAQAFRIEAVHGRRTQGADHARASSSANPASPSRRCSAPNRRRRRATALASSSSTSSRRMASKSPTRSTPESHARPVSPRRQSATHAAD